MGAVTVDQAKLVLNSFAHVLQNNLVSADVVEWDEFDGEMDDTNGLKIVEQVTPRYNVTRTVNGVKDLSAGQDGTVFGAELFTIDGTFNANMSWGDFVKIRDIGAARESKALLGAATSMAEKIDAYILGVAALASNNWVGAAAGTGGNVATSIDAAQAYTRLKEEGVSDNDLSYVFNYTDRMYLADQLIKLPAPDNLASSTYREGFNQQLGGIKALFTNQLPVLTVGSRPIGPTAQVNGAAQNKDYSAVAVQTTANGLFMTQTLAVNTLGATDTIAAGEVFTIAGVFAYDQRKQALVQPARLQQFTVVTAATAVAGAIAALRIFPAMIVPGSGAGDNININTAHATVGAAPGAGALITFIGAANANLSPRLLIQKEAIVVNTVPLILPASDTAMRRQLSKIPLSVRMWQHSEFTTGVHSVRFDVAINANVRERRRITRVNGLT